MAAKASRNCISRILLQVASAKPLWHAKPKHMSCTSGPTPFQPQLRWTEVAQHCNDAPWSRKLTEPSLIKPKCPTLSHTSARPTRKHQYQAQKTKGCITNLHSSLQFTNSVCGGSVFLFEGNDVFLVGHNGLTLGVPEHDLLRTRERATSQLGLSPATKLYQPPGKPQLKMII